MRERFVCRKRKNGLQISHEHRKQIRPGRKRTSTRQRILFVAVNAILRCIEIALRQLAYHIVIKHAIDLIEAVVFVAARHEIVNLTAPCQYKLIVGGKFIKGKAILFEIKRVFELTQKKTNGVSEVAICV